jgi:hypothetical protein
LFCIPMYLLDTWIPTLTQTTLSRHKRDTSGRFNTSIV